MRTMNSINSIPKFLTIVCFSFSFILLSSAFAWGQIVINEINYDPEDNTKLEEFVELFNPTRETVDLSGWRFDDGIDFTFPQGTVIESGDFLVVVQSPEHFKAKYGEIEVVGPFEGQLSNDGEQVRLIDTEDRVVDEVDYGVGFPWPLDSNGEGSSMELLHWKIDNDLGGSWRASGRLKFGFDDRLFYLNAQSTEWKYRKGLSNPPADWKELDFVEDESWLEGATPIGYGDDDDATILDDMRGAYSTVYLRHKFTVSEVPEFLMVGSYVDDGMIVWINGVEVGRLHVSEGEKNFDDGGRNHEAEWEEIIVSSPRSILKEGENVIAIHALNLSARSNDFSVDATVFRPSDEDSPPENVATPGSPNTVFTNSIPPQIRQVEHTIEQPKSDEVNSITCKITDPEGMGLVDLLYQEVEPGNYIPATLPHSVSQLIARPLDPREPNPEFEDNASWIRVPMRDDGQEGDLVADDSIYTATIPGQRNRTLIRYRILANDRAGNSILVPYKDDPSLNFAYFVYDGIPDYHAEISITGRATIHSAEDLNSIPVYHLIARNRDILDCVAATGNLQIPQGNNARHVENWEGAFVYNGKVYDHIHFRLRGANGRYQVPAGNPGGTAGKRHWRFNFNRGNHLRVRDKWGNRYPTRWRVLNTGRMFGNRIDGNWGLGDQVNDIIWRAYGIPAPFGHPFHFRVIDGGEEAPEGNQGQYMGDFWGIARAFENYDVRFLEAHGLEKGNLYKLVNQTKNPSAQQRYQAPGAVTNGSDHNNIESNLNGSRPPEWLDAHVNYEKWYHYHAIAQALKHYDYWPSANKNATWYFDTDYREENGFLGRMWTLPFDTDATWGPTWNQGIDRPYDAIHSGGGKLSFQIEYRNHIREVQDLLWQQDQLNLVIRQTASFMDQIFRADVDRWRNAPSREGRQYFPASSQSSPEGKARDMLRFAFQGGSWPGGSEGAGGRNSVLTNLSDGRDRNAVPETPQIEFVGKDGFPLDDLRFRANEFNDPQGPDSFEARMWRISEVSAISSPSSVPLSDPVWRASPVKLELTAHWESSEVMVPEIKIPTQGLNVGATYRVRSRVKDNSGRWSHWSEPIQFELANPSEEVGAIAHLRITEIMYNPEGGSEFEFIELQNIGQEPVNLSSVRFTEGIKFNFEDSNVTWLGEGEILVVVENLDAFKELYGEEGILIAGQYSGRLANDGERIRLDFAGNVPILDFTYSDTWYEKTDGEGLSLNIKNPHTPVEHWSNRESWFPSSVRGGTPGFNDSRQPPEPGLKPGDANLNGRIDLTDVIYLLLLLFQPGDIALPCEGDHAGDGENAVFFDANQDELIAPADAVHLMKYLFLQGPPHGLGTECQLFETCGNEGEGACF